MSASVDFDTLEWLHIYGQFCWHSDANIRGTREGLTALRDAINDALETGEGKAAVVASDGEGYPVIVTRVNTCAALGSPEYIMERQYDLGQAELRRSKAIHYRQPEKV